MGLTSQQRDTKDVKIFVDWFHLHSPLSYSEKDNLVSIGSGEVADSLVNCDKAYTIGIKAAGEVTGKEFTSIKLTRLYRLISTNIG